ncbi:3-keto-5-aminohexanoate cleavage protein [Streptosporangium sp. CA-135522]|uniref:3-keto-5-aminohexanoate cleavage protein n=1 Tax=Streptosporangium sp. CA-135522 TaxID=3240072 RepID=UPI003D923D84
MASSSTPTGRGWKGPPPSAITGMPSPLSPPRGRAMSRPVIITCAPTGGIHAPTMSPHPPVTPDEIASASIGAAEAGAAIILLHARNPGVEEPPDSRYR